LILREKQRIEKRIEGVPSFLKMEGMYYNVTLRRFRAIIITVEKKTFYTI